MTGGATMSTDRVWATKWYRITPRSFVHEELFFDPDQIVRVAAGESYKSFLLRRDGRADHAHTLGQEYRNLAADRILSETGNEVIPISDIQEIRLSTGSLLRKPKLKLVAEGRDYEYYHSSRKYDSGLLAEQLSEQYSSLPVRLDSEKV